MFGHILVSFLLPYPKMNEDEKMSTTLEKLKGKTSEEILSIYGEKDKYPIDIVEIAKKAGIQLGSIDFTKLEKKDSFKDIVSKRGHILGAVTFDGEAINIIYHNALHDEDDDLEFKNLSDVDKKDKLLRRQRFTIAHEIAHCCLNIDEGEPHIEYRTDQKDYKSEKERNANIFAGELLMPKDSIEDLCGILNNKVSLSFLADIFKVSRHVMQARLEYLKKEGHLSELKVFI